MKPWIAMCCTATLFACAEAGVGDGTTGLPSTLTTEVVLFEREHLYYDAQMPRTALDVAVALPDQGPHNPYSRVSLELEISCPGIIHGQCDWWDRPGEFYLVDDDGNAIEFARFMTPYRRGGSWSVDVTDLQTLLTGSRTVRVHITTYVGPRINSQYGLGWIVSAKLVYEPGEPERLPVAALPLPFGVVNYGDPAQPTARTASVEIPDGVSSAGIYMLITGHGQGNSENCAEFCAQQHSIGLGGAQLSTVIWRDDCHLNPVHPQAGTWQAPRAGWCPGDVVRPWRADAGAISAGSYTVTYDPEAYENTCRPDSPMCTGCVFETGCEYNGGLHTVPRFVSNGFLILYH
jgi:hypothetical protein